MYFFTTAKAQSRQGDLPYDDAEIDAKLKQIRADLEELKLKQPPGKKPKTAAEPPEAVEPEPKAAATPPEAEERPRHV